jgi:hypothetical protein
MFDAESTGHAAMREYLGGLEAVNWGHTSGWIWSYPLRAALELAFANGDLTREGLVAAVEQLETVDYEGMLPEEAGRFAGEPNDTVFRDVVINRPDANAPSGVTMVEDFFVGPTAEAYDFSQPCQAAEIIAAYPSRSGAAVLLLADTTPSGSTPIELTHDGHLHLPGPDLDLAAAGLTESEAAACATLFALDPIPGNITVPTSRNVNDQKTATDEAGALVPEQTEARPVDHPAGPDSLLPKETEQYVAAAATTTADIDQLAPVTTHPRPDLSADAVSADVNAPADSDAAASEKDRAGGTAEYDDAALNDTVDSWYADDCPFPRLTLLGPLAARTNGDHKAVARRRPFYLELLTYLVLHPDGVTGAQMAEDFGLKIQRLRTDIAEVRKWLGTNPDTG